MLITLPGLGVNGATAAVFESAPVVGPETGNDDDL